MSSHGAIESSRNWVGQVSKKCGENPNKPTVSSSGPRLSLIKIICSFSEIKHFFICFIPTFVETVPQWQPSHCKGWNQQFGWKLQRSISESGSWNNSGSSSFCSKHAKPVSRTCYWPVDCSWRNANPYRSKRKRKSNRNFLWKMPPRKQYNEFYDRELLELVRILKGLKFYIAGSGLEIIMDSQVLKNLTKPKSNRIKTKWIKTLETYGFSYQFDLGELHFLENAFPRERNVQEESLASWI